MVILSMRFVGRRSPSRKQLRACCRADDLGRFFEAKKHRPQFESPTEAAQAASSPHKKQKAPRKAGLFLGASGLESPKTEVGGFTVPCNCHYATPPDTGKKCWRKELNPQPSDYKSGALPLSYASKEWKYSNKSSLFLRYFVVQQ